MKIILPGILFLTVFTHGSAQNKLVINGNLQGLKGRMPVYVRAADNSRSDSATARDGKFMLDLQVPSGDIYFLQAGKDNRAENASLLLYLQAGELNINGKGPLFKDVILSGSQFVVDYNSFMEKLKAAPVTKTSDEITKKYNEAITKNDIPLVRRLEAQLAKTDTSRAEIAEEWVNTHLQSPISAFLLYVYVKPYKAIGEFELLFDKLTPEAKDNSVARKLQNSLDISKLTAVGRQAPDFTQNDPQGKPVSLQDFKGKYVLVDFWASWCEPCREENPNLVKAFSKYKNKNFTVLGVSLDRDKAKWLAAIQKDGLPWTQVSDLKYWDNDVAKQYDIGYIPANLLVDTNGKIIARNLRGDDLTNKLHEIFGN